MHYKRKSSWRSQLGDRGTGSGEGSLGEGCGQDAEGCMELGEILLGPVGRTQGWTG